MAKNLLVGISQLSVKMRLLKAYYGADSDAAELNDRQVLILETLADQGPMSVTDLAKRFCGVAQSTISSDIKEWRSPENAIVEIQLDQQDIRKHMVTLTELGKRKVADIRRQRAKMFDPLGKALPQELEKAKVIEDVVNNAIQLVDEKLASLDKG